MFPLHDRNPTAALAVVTLVLIAVNVGVFFLVQQGQRGTETVLAADGEEVPIDADLSFTYEWAAIPCEIVERRPLGLDEIEATVVGGDDTACAPSEAEAGRRCSPTSSSGSPCSCRCSCTAAGSTSASNMLFLWVFGNNVEDRLGTLRYVAFYVAGGIVATIAYVAVEPSSTVPLVGASGAIAAVMGAYLVWYPERPHPDGDLRPHHLLHRDPGPVAARLLVRPAVLHEPRQRRRVGRPRRRLRLRRRSPAS